jgi:lipopolysaccharide/colanic/teichoic acid biosynthesis glycosyltransferase
MPLFGPKHTFESVATALLAGLQNGTVVLDSPELDTSGRESEVIARLRLAPPRSSAYRVAKTVADIVIGALLLIVCSPVILVCWAAIRLTSSGPAFYSQIRTGLRGKRFRLFKLRTMYHNCEARSGIRWSMPGDSRITHLGRLLRKLHWDELPQLLNVIRGEMSLVGPKPERPEIDSHLEPVVPSYRERYRVKPGVTGLAQLVVGSYSTVDGIRRTLLVDLYYSQHTSLWLDIRIVVGTSLTVFGVSRSWACWLCGLGTYDQIYAQMIQELAGEPARVDRSEVSAEKREVSLPEHFGFPEPSVSSR